MWNIIFFQNYFRGIIAAREYFPTRSCRWNNSEIISVFYFTCNQGLTSSDTIHLYTRSLYCSDPTPPGNSSRSSGANNMPAAATQLITASSVAPPGVRLLRLMWSRLQWALSFNSSRSVRLPWWWTTRKKTNNDSTRLKCKCNSVLDLRSEN